MGRVPEGVGLEGVLVGVISKSNGYSGLHRVGTAGEGRRTWVRLLRFIGNPRREIDKCDISLFWRSKHTYRRFALECV